MATSHIPYPPVSSLQGVMVGPHMQQQHQQQQQHHQLAAFSNASMLPVTQGASVFPPPPGLGNVVGNSEDGNATHFLPPLPQHILQQQLDPSHETMQPQQQHPMPGMGLDISSVSGGMLVGPAMQGQFYSTASGALVSHLQQQQQEHSEAVSAAQQQQQDQQQQSDQAFPSEAEQKWTAMGPGDNQTLSLALMVCTAVAVAAMSVWLPGWLPFPLFSPLSSQSVLRPYHGCVHVWVCGTVCTCVGVRPPHQQGSNLAITTRTPDCPLLLLLVFLARVMLFSSSFMLLLS
ncbi:hypothetical protein FHG87_003320 [Trinorchestia longiramus]|nr:hypothetical protein FHG87_003320 [Trinorchestia longiramus]